MAHLVVALWNPWKQNKNMGHKIYYGTINHCPFWKYSHNRYVKSRIDSDGWASDSSNTAWPSVWCCQAGNGRIPLYKYICYLEVRRTALSSCEQSCSLLLRGIFTTQPATLVQYLVSFTQFYKMYLHYYLMLNTSYLRNFQNVGKMNYS